MDRIIIIDDSGIQDDLNRFLETNKTNIRLDSDFIDLSTGRSSLIKEIIDRYEDKFKVKIQSKDKVHLFRINEIIFFKAMPEGTKLFLVNNNTLLLDGNIETVSSQLKDHPFIAVHPNYLVNFHHIVRISNSKKTKIEMSNGESLPVSERNKEIIMKELGKYYT
ncbi:MAG TPA: LytTR family transcriptional regulator DNA-binding domain-containing protein [Bacteroidales bacterium]|nr:LytTR family transcriptional regulator DNA-binding domain-containing protein [Bacteroidales bacterium]HPE57943.1 LytTR family transcriptional regulator DNA-binding domain-containing protein [Bacteroidales bacterium]HRX97368.1 LytTR family transcriptional regulator DNA-binding domain-containing protein [Bacteroidales bacterium]